MPRCEADSVTRDAAEPHQPHRTLAETWLAGLPRMKPWALRLSDHLPDRLTLPLCCSVSPALGENVGAKTASGAVSATGGEAHFKRCHHCANRLGGAGITPTWFKVVLWCPVSRRPTCRFFEASRKKAVGGVRRDICACTSMFAGLRRGTRARLETPPSYLKMVPSDATMRQAVGVGSIILDHSKMSCRDVLPNRAPC